MCKLFVPARLAGASLGLVPGATGVAPAPLLAASRPLLAVAQACLKIKRSIGVWRNG